MRLPIISLPGRAAKPVNFIAALFCVALLYTLFYRYQNTTYSDIAVAGGSNGASSSSSSGAADSGADDSGVDGDHSGISDHDDKSQGSDIGDDSNKGNTTYKGNSEDKDTKVDVGGYHDGPAPLDRDASTYEGPEVEMVVASQKHENTSWIADHLGDWGRSVYVVNDDEAELTVPLNKGREAMVYLTYIIDRYISLPPITIFHHAQRFQWHNDDRDYDALPLLRNLRLPHVHDKGYVNLRCAWVLGCPDEIYPLRDEPQPEPLVPEGEEPPAGRPRQQQRREADPQKQRQEKLPREESQQRSNQPAPLKASNYYATSFRHLLPSTPVPSVVGVPCCSQFALSRSTIRSRPLAFYVHVREWVIATELSDDISGRVLEYMWHIFWGQEAVACPPAGECYCDVFGECGMKGCGGFGPGDKQIGSGSGEKGENGEYGGKKGGDGKGKGGDDKGKNPGGEEEKGEVNEEVAGSEGNCEGRYILPPYATLPKDWPRIGWDGENRGWEGEI